MLDTTDRYEVYYDGFRVGDGHHSLESAKAWINRTYSEEERAYGYFAVERIISVHEEVWSQGTP